MCGYHVLEFLCVCMIRNSSGGVRLHYTIHQSSQHKSQHDSEKRIHSNVVKGTETMEYPVAIFVIVEKNSYSQETD